ncbi:MAG: M15 family metallopeptidase [Gemmatimonadota bacterium]|nr:M15 family metallopeptidase [Gemmatimonadota bacterium]
MPDIKDTVGEGGANNVHDVALVQAMLRVVKDAKGQPYLGGNYDGVYGGQTKAAIQRFQADQKLVPPPPGTKDGKTLIGVAGATIQKLSAMLPPAYTDIRIIEKMKTVYVAASDVDAKAGQTTVNGEPNVDPAFRGKALQAVKQTYADYKIAFTVGPNGGRRTFAQQAKIATTGATTVGPGESNHNWGRALDLLPVNFQWLKGDGTVVKDTPWLEQLEKQKGVAQADQIWDARDVAVKAAGLFLIKTTQTFRDRPHVQAWDQNAVNMGNALVALLNAVDAIKWANAGGSPRQYSCDLRLAGAEQVKIGTAVQIWNTQAKVAAADVVTAVNKAQIALDDARLIWGGKAVVKKAAFKPIAAKDVKATDITAIQKALKKSFELADQNFLKWKP